MSLGNNVCYCKLRNCTDFGNDLGWSTSSLQVDVRSITTPVLLIRPRKRLYATCTLKKKKNDPKMGFRYSGVMGMRSEGSEVHGVSGGGFGRTLLGF